MFPELAACFAVTQTEQPLRLLIHLDSGGAFLLAGTRGGRRNCRPVMTGPGQAEDRPDP